MVGETCYKIYVTPTEAEVIKEFYEILTNCPIELGDHEFVDIMSEIAKYGNDPEEDGVEIIYEEEQLHIRNTRRNISNVFTMKTTESTTTIIKSCMIFI